jgi:hypothetical protein
MVVIKDSSGVEGSRMHPAPVRLRTAKSGVTKVFDAVEMRRLYFGAWEEKG